MTTDESSEEMVNTLEFVDSVTIDGAIGSDTIEDDNDDDNGDGMSAESTSAYSIESFIHDGILLLRYSHPDSSGGVLVASVNISDVR